MKVIASAVAAAVLLLSPVGASSSAFASLSAGSLSEAVPQAAKPLVQEVRHRKRYERRMRHERRVRHERRATRRCIRYGHCTVVYILVPTYYTVPIWYSAPIFYHHY